MTIITYMTLIENVILHNTHEKCIPPFYMTGTEENQKKRKCEYVNREGCPAIVGTAANEGSILLTLTYLMRSTGGMTYAKVFSYMCKLLHAMVA
jgi:hypothetical protein